MGLQALAESILSRLPSFRKNAVGNLYLLDLVRVELGKWKASLERTASFIRSENFLPKPAELMAATPMITSMTCGILLMKEFKRDFDPDFKPSSQLSGPDINIVYPTYFRFIDKFRGLHRCWSYNLSFTNRRQ